MIKDVNILLSSPKVSLKSVVDNAVMMDFDDDTKEGYLVENNLSKEYAESLCNTYDFYALGIGHTFSVVTNTPVISDTTISMRPQYCAKCGNSGYTLDGNICPCKFNADTFFNEVSCLEIPEQYRGINFSTALLPSDLDTSYKEKMFEIFSNVSTTRSSNHNYLICSPHKHGKTIMAYSCIERLFKAGIPVFPVCDIMEIRRIMHEVDIGKESVIGINNPEDIWKVPYLFVKIPTYTTWEIYDTINTLTSRRVRQGNSTIYLYSGTYSMLLKGDHNDLLTSMKGDGSFSTLDIQEWSRRTIEDD